MPQFTQAAFNTFVGGLLTESGELTFPENASVDEDNCDLLKDGSRRRRLGVQMEGDYSWITANDAPAVAVDTVVTTHVWKNVAEQADVEFLVVQVGTKMFFYQQSDAALSQSRVNESFTSTTPYLLDLNSYTSGGEGGVAANRCECTHIKGGLIVANAAMNTILITRDPDTGAFTVKKLKPKIRDYEWQGDVEAEDYANDEKNISDERYYDTRNAGWPSGKINKFKNENNNKYPALTHPWFSGKNENGNFDPDEWGKIAIGSNTLITNGHYKQEIYPNVTRSGLTTKTESSRFSTVASYAGRVFFGGMPNSTNNNGSKIFWCQQLEQNFDRIDRFYSTNDPTSEVLSDLLDTDGGYLVIPEAYDIKKLHVFGAALYVFAQNGVWKISGVDDVFRASDYAVTKVSSDGISARGSFISAESRPYWWSNSGIFTMVADDLGGIKPENLSIQTIQTFWDNITPDARDNVKGIYDAGTRRVMWFYQSEGVTNTNKFNQVIMLDEVLKSFIPWTISDMATDTHYIAGAAYYTGIGSNAVTYNIQDSSLNNVIDSSSNDVVSLRSGRSLASSKVKLLVVNGTTGYVSFADVTATDFTDWGEADYSSYAEGAYNFLGDMETFKTVPYLTVYMRDTATGWTASGDGYTIDRDSGMKISCYWDFGSTPTTIAQEAYRRKRTPIPDPAALSTFTYGNNVQVSRLRMRGRGRVVRLRFESDTGKDFHLLGWNAIGQKNGKF